MINENGVVDCNPNLSLDEKGKLMAEVQKICVRHGWFGLCTDEARQKIMVTLFLEEKKDSYFRYMKMRNGGET